MSAVAGTLLAVSGLVVYAPVAAAQSAAPDYSWYTKTLTKEQLAGFNKLTAEQKDRLFNPSYKGPELPEGTVDCLQYLGFGEISVEVSPSSHEAAPGTSLSFEGKVINPLDRPLVDGQVFVKIFYRNKKSADSERLNGHRLVDQFIALDNLSLPANGEKAVSFAWKVPQSTPEGEYEAAFFLASAYRFNLTGLTFTNDVTGNKASFVVTKGAARAAYLDEDAVSLNKTAYHPTQPIPVFSATDKVTAHLKIVNPKKENAKVAITRKLYFWDSLDPSNLVSTNTETVTLKAGETRTLSYEVPPMGHSVSYLVVEATDGDAKSVVNLRFGRTGIEEARNNFLGMLTYPLEKGKTSTLFACAHVAGVRDMPGSGLTITLNDEKGEALHTFSYMKGITASPLGFKDDFTLDRNLYDFSLTATVLQNGKPAQETTVHYRCADIDPNLCSQNNFGWKALLGAAALVLLAAYFIWRRRETASVPPIVSTP